MAATIHIDDTNFDQEVIQSDKPVLVDFWAEWCSPCRMISPMVEDLAREFDGKVKIVKVDVDKSSEVSSKYAVTSIPTLIMFQNGQPVDKLVGAVSKNKIKGIIEGVL